MSAIGLFCCASFTFILKIHFLRRFIPALFSFLFFPFLSVYVCFGMTIPLLLFLLRMPCLSPLPYRAQLLNQARGVTFSPVYTECCGWAFLFLPTHPSLSRSRPVSQPVLHLSTRSAYCQNGKKTAVAPSKRAEPNPLVLCRLFCPFRDAIPSHAPPVFFRLFLLPFHLLNPQLESVTGCWVECALYEWVFLYESCPKEGALASRRRTVYPL